MIGRILQARPGIHLVGTQRKNSKREKERGVVMFWFLQAVYKWAEGYLVRTFTGIPSPSYMYAAPLLLFVFFLAHGFRTSCTPTN